MAVILTRGGCFFLHYTILHHTTQHYTTLFSYSLFLPYDIGNREEWKEISEWQSLFQKRDHRSNSSRLSTEKKVEKQCSHRSPQ